jgi:SAM-dependent methyltransferase/tetratricopeptide (TPR) repeat protein
MNRKERRAAGRRGPAPSLRSAPTAASATAIAELFGAAVAQHRAGALADAERAYRRVIEMSPAHAEAHSRLGAVLMGRGKSGEAIAHMERAAALDPGLFEAHANLAQAYTWTGAREAAIEAAYRALELHETPQTRAIFARAAGFARFNADEERFRGLLTRALSEAWVRPRELTRACISLISNNRAVKEAVARTDEAWPRRLSTTDLFGRDGLRALASDRLLCRLLESDPIPDLGLERLLTAVRGTILADAVAQAVVDEDCLSFYCSLARQCYINEYVFTVTASEADEAQRLHALLESALANGQPCSPLWPIAIGAYLPLHLVAGAQALLERPWPHWVKALLTQQITEPVEERRLAAAIPALTEIEGEVSRVVRQQYEENPYPRWLAAAVSGQSPVRLNRQPAQPFDALIAGCGTGLSTAEFSREAPSARILAIDLSRASLGYALRMTRELELPNIEFAQADITRLGSLGRAFDFIDASGVLHHLADPWEGWRILLSLLRPGGRMQVGLYSELARRNVVAARALIAERGYRPTPHDIRRCREQVMVSDDPLLKSLLASSDFFTVGECRDLLFHVQEHRTSLPEIKAFLAANDLAFAGFHLDALILNAFSQRFPSPAAVTDLDCWHAFETEAPSTFAGMYQFSVRKRTAGSA